MKGFYKVFEKELIQAPLIRLTGHYLIFSSLQ